MRDVFVYKKLQEREELPKLSEEEYKEVFSKIFGDDFEEEPIQIKKIKVSKFKNIFKKIFGGKIQNG